MDSTRVAPNDSAMYADFVRCRDVDGGLDLLIVRMQSKEFPGVSEGEYQRFALPTYRSFVQKRQERL